MAPRTQILLEGYSPEEVLGLPDDVLDGIVLTGEPLVFSAGSAQVLGEFQIEGGRLVVELAQVDGGGEGVLKTLWLLTDRYARKRKLETVEWIVHAVACAEPNLKLRRVLDRFGFEIRDLPRRGRAYHYVHQL